MGYLKQQYNYAYSRLEITRKFKKPHDHVTGLGMILNVPLTWIVLLMAAVGSLVSPLAPLSLVVLPLVHVPKMVNLLMKRREVCILALPVVFTMRNLTWTWASVVWIARQMFSKLKTKHHD